MSQKSQHMRSFVAKIITYAHFCRKNHNIRALRSKEKIGLHKSGTGGTGGSPFYDFFLHKNPSFFETMASLRLDFCSPVYTNCSVFWAICATPSLPSCYMNASPLLDWIFVALAVCCGAHAEPGAIGANATSHLRCFH